MLDKIKLLLSTHKRLKPIRRSNMILLELLISIAIIGLFSSGLILSPTQCFITQLGDLEKLELQRIADNILLDIHTHFKEKHPWSSLTKEEKAFPLPTIKLSIDSRHEHEYDCSYKLKIKKEAESPSKTLYRFVSCKLLITKKTSLHTSKPLLFSSAVTLQLPPKNNLEL